MNAMSSLYYMQEQKWNKSPKARTKIFNCDMRDFVSDRKADIVVSELLGSFSDNELSPECLDGVYRSVQKDAISIPQKYTSFLEPVMSSKLWNNVSALEGPAEQVKLMEGNYVVNIRNAFFPSHAEPVFQFEHKDLSLSPDQRDNTRVKTLTFVSPVTYVCHGFAGYFDTHLYPTELRFKLSTVRERETDGMFSWFPIYFPLVTPIEVKANEKLTVTFWRKTSNTAVWYEFAVTEPSYLRVQNPSGRSHCMGLAA